MSDPNAYELNDFLPYLLNQAADSLSLEFQTTYRSKYGMLRTEWRVLFHLGSFGELTAKDICDRARLHKTKVSRAVAALRDKGYLTRQTPKDDRRVSVLQLTPKGTEVFIDLRDDARAFDAKLQADLNTDDFETLKRVLTKLAAL